MRKYPMHIKYFINLVLRLLFIHTSHACVRFRTRNGTTMADLILTRDLASCCLDSFQLVHTLNVHAHLDQCFDINDIPVYAKGGKKSLNHFF